MANSGFQDTPSPPCPALSTYTATLTALEDPSPASPLREPALTPSQGLTLSLDLTPATLPHGQPQPHHCFLVSLAPTAARRARLLCEDSPVQRAACRGRWAPLETFQSTRRASAPRGQDREMGGYQFPRAQVFYQPQDTYCLGLLSGSSQPPNPPSGLCAGRSTLHLLADPSACWPCLARSRC